MEQAADDICIFLFVTAKGGSCCQTAPSHLIPQKNLGLRDKSRQRGVSSSPCPPFQAAHEGQEEIMSPKHGRHGKKLITW